MMLEERDIWIRQIQLLSDWIPEDFKKTEGIRRGEGAFCF